MVIILVYNVPGVPKERIFSTLRGKSIIFYIIDKASSAEENDTKIIKFGWVILILCPLLEIQSFSNFAWFLRPMSEELCREKPSISGADPGFSFRGGAQKVMCQQAHYERGTEPRGGGHSTLIWTGGGCRWGVKTWPCLKPLAHKKYTLSQYTFHNIPFICIPCTGTEGLSHSAVYHHTFIKICCVPHAPSPTRRWCRDRGPVINIVPRSRACHKQLNIVVPRAPSRRWCRDRGLS